MLDYTTNNMSELIKSVFINKNNAEFNIDTIFKAEKKNGTLVEKEIWPASAVTLNLATSYDFYTDKVTKLPNSAYSGPSVADYILDQRPLEITVTPYPIASKWKITHSENLVDSEVFNVSYSGVKTLTIPTILTQESIKDDVKTTEHYCWIKIVPDTLESQAQLPIFQFYIRHIVKDGSGEEEVASDPLFKWTFDNSTNILVDDISKKSLTTYKNKYSWNDESMIARIKEGHIGNALKAVNITSPELSCILVDNVVYKRMIDADQEEATNAKRCWIDSSTETVQIYTSLDYDTLVNSNLPLQKVYTASGEIINQQIQDVFLTESNYYSCHTGLDLTDNSKTYTIAGYVHYTRGFDFGFREFLNLGMGYYSVTPSMNKSGKFTTTSFKSNWDIRKYQGIKDWRHLAVTKTAQKDIFVDDYDTLIADHDIFSVLNSESLFSDEKGYGFIVYSGYYVKDLGYPYVRDPEKDANGKFAFTWTKGDIDNNTMPIKDEQEVPTVWLVSENPADGDIAYGEDGITEISTIKSSNTYPKIPYKLEYVDYNNIPDNPRYSDTPYLVGKVVGSRAQNGRLNTGTFSEASVFKYIRYYRVGYCYANGSLAAIGYIYQTTPTSSAPVDNDLFRIKLLYTNSTNDQTYDGVDEVCIYDRPLTSNELKRLQDEFAVEATEKKPALPTTYNVEQAQRKIKVDNSWYYQDADLNYYSPTSDDNTHGYFGWRKLSGNSTIEKLWTNEPDSLTKNTKCEIEKGSGLSEAYKIQDIDYLSIKEVPFKCDLVPYIIDNTTVAIVINAHDEVIRCMRRLFPGVEAVAYNNENGYLKTDYSYGFTVNCLAWRTHKYCQEEISYRADNAQNWKFDNNDVILLSRIFTAPYDFFRFKAIQWRNSQPGEKYYASNAACPPFDGHAPEIMQIAYLKLNQPMAEGTSHTVTWCGNSCTVKYAHDFGCSTIKINQEGYLPWTIKRAYLGRWLGAGSEATYISYMPAETDRTFYVVPYSKPNIANAVFSGTMTQRSTFGKTADKNDPARKCSDQYGVGGNSTRPLNAENVFEMDFSNINTVRKDAIKLNNISYFRDEIEDFTAGFIIVNGKVYDRNTEKDTCNAYAWSEYADDNITVLSTIYTDTHIPTAEEKARLGYDDYSVALDIEDVVPIKLLGWSTERITEEDYSNYQTIWTTERVYDAASFNGTIYNEKGFSTNNSVDCVYYNVETQDISGYYQIYIPNIGWSFKFPIHPIGYFHAHWTAQRGLFHQRSGCPNVKHPYTNWEYPHAAHEILYKGNFVSDSGQASDTSYVWAVDPETHETLLDSSGIKIQLATNGTAFSQNADNDKYNVQPMYGLHGGWFDAADFDLRQQHIPTVRDLAIAYCIYPDNFSAGQLDLPESTNGIPDILNEALWGAQLWLHSQEPNGAIHGWFETRAHEASWPWNSSMKYYCSAPSLNHTMAWAASAATLARALRIAASRSTDALAIEKMKELEKTYTDSACAAFTYATKEYYDLYMKLPDTEREPSVYFEAKGKTWAWKEYCSVFKTENTPSSGLKSSMGTDMFSAVCALYALTKEKRYKKYLTPEFVHAHVCYFPSGDLYAMNTTDVIAWELLTVLKDEFPDYYEQIKAKYIEYSDFWINMQEKHAYRWFSFEPGHKYSMNLQWGAGHPSGRCGVVLAAWIATHDEKYRNAIIAAFDQVYGCNSLGRTWVVGSGYVYPARHLDSWLPQNTVNNDLWASRPGISPYYMGYNHQMDYKIRKMCVGLMFEGRPDQNCPAIDCRAAYPDYLKRIIGNAMDTYYYKASPFQAAAQLYGSETLHVAAFEYTMWETITRKAMLLGMLMGKHNKPRFWFKQIAPAKGLQAESNIRNFSFLP